MAETLSVAVGRLVRHHQTPLESIRNLEGKIWRRVIAKGELDTFQQEHAVISTKLVAGRTVIHVFSCTPL